MWILFFIQIREGRGSTIQIGYHVDDVFNKSAPCRYLTTLCCTATTTHVQKSFSFCERITLTFYSTAKQLVVGQDVCGAPRVVVVVKKNMGDRNYSHDSAKFYSPPLFPLDSSAYSCFVECSSAPALPPAKFFIVRVKTTGKTSFYIKIYF